LIERWKASKATGLKLFDPERGESYDVFNACPLSDDIKEHCVQDVHFFVSYGSNIIKGYPRLDCKESK
jgi:hypothetical protein